MSCSDPDPAAQLLYVRDSDPDPLFSRHHFPKFENLEYLKHSKLEKEKYLKV